MAAEGNIVGEVGLIVKPVDNGFNADVQRIINKIESQAQFKVGADTSSASSAVQALTGQANQLGESFAQSAINVAGITAAVYALKGAANTVIGKFSTLFDQLAQAKAGFSSILKSENAGNNLLTDIQEFARVSPFVTQELVNYSQQLLGVGLSAERITPLLKDVGNIISSVGGDTQNLGRVLFTLTQIQSIGRLAGQDAMQLQSALIPITKYLSEYLGKTTVEVKKLQEQGKISADTVFAAITAQGKNVEGAMDKATRNIAGARAILSDTITLMLQRSPELQKIFEDIFKSIVKFSNYLSQDDVSVAIDEFMTSVGKIYEGLKPLGVAIADIGSTVGINGLKSITSILSAFGAALDAIPEPAIKLFAGFIVTMGAVRAPLMLLKYVNSFQNLYQGVMRAATGVSKANVEMEENAIAANSAAAANGRFAAALNKVGIAATGTGTPRKGLGADKAAAGLGIGLGVAGSFVSDGNGGTRDAIGTTAQFAAIGSIAGPWGIAAGAAIGALSSIASTSRKVAKQVREDAKEAAAGWAAEFQKNLTYEFGSDVTKDSLYAYLAESDKSASLIATYQERLKTTQEEIDRLGGPMALAFAGTQTTALDKAKSSADGYRLAIQKAKDEQEALFGPDSQSAEYLRSLADDIAKIQFANPVAENQKLRVPDFPGNLVPQRTFSADQLSVLTGQTTPDSIADMKLIEAELKSWGITLDDIATKTEPEILAMVTLFSQLPDSIRDAVTAASSWNDKLKEGAATADTMWGPAKAQISSIISYNTAITSALDAQTKAAFNLKDENAQLAAQRELDTIRGQAYAMALATMTEGLSKEEAALVATTAAERAYQDAIEFRALASESALATQRFQTDEVITNLLELAGVVDSVENRQVVIDVTSKGIEAVMARLTILQQKMIDVETGKGLDGKARRVVVDDLDEAIARQKKELDKILSGAQDKSLGAKVKADIANRDAETIMADAIAANTQAADEAARKAQEWATAVESATASLTNSIDAAAESIKAAADSWIGSIKERTQYEQAVSTGRLIRNTNRQVADVAELTAGLENLKNRGVPQSVIDALGINNVTDTRQLRKLVNSSDADLMALATSLATLNTSATDLATSQEDKRTRTNITQAIIEAAKQLDLNLSKDQAAGISNQFVITPGTNAEDIALQILNVLTSGRIGV